MNLFCVSLSVSQLKSEPDSPSSVGVMDRSRLLLCALTFFCLSLNPLPSLLGSEASGSPNFSPGHGPSRTLVWFPSHTQDFGEQGAVYQGSWHILKVYNSWLNLWHRYSKKHSDLTACLPLILQHPGFGACCRGWWFGCWAGWELCGVASGCFTCGSPSHPSTRQNLCRSGGTGNKLTSI